MKSNNAASPDLKTDPIKQEFPDSCFLYTQSGHKLRFFKGGKAQFVTVGIIVNAGDTVPIYFEYNSDRNEEERTHEKRI
jgi:hypothetical protein